MTRPEIPNIARSRILIVEGKDESEFFGAMLEHIGLFDVIQVMAIGGKTQFKDKIKLLTISPNFKDNVEAIGIVRDSDGNSTGAFQGVCSALRFATLPIPKRVMTFSVNDPKTIVMVMPPKKMGTNRMLEDLCLESVLGDSAMKCVTQYFQCLEQEGVSMEDHVVAKARIHVFLASREEPDLRLGEAARKGYWPFDNPAFAQVRRFLRQLAGKETD